MTSTLRSRTHVVVASVGLLLACAYLVAPDPLGAVLVPAVYALGALVVTLRSRDPAPSPRRAWQAIALGMAGQTVYSLMTVPRVAVAAPGVWVVAAQAVELGALLLMFAGGLRLLGPVARRDVAELAEVGVVWVASATIPWTVLLNPLLVERGTTDRDRLVELVWWLVAAGSAGVVARLAVRHPAGRGTLRYLTAAAALGVLGNLLNVVTFDPVTGAHAQAVGAVWILAGACMAASTAHPTSVELGRPVAPSRPTMSTARLVLFAVAVGLTPIVAGLQQLAGQEVDWLLVTVSTAMIVPLMTLSLARANRVQVEARRAMEWLATHDELTGLPNRRAATARLAEQLAVLAAAADGEASGVNVLFLDVDGLKEVNDGHGHGAGDRLLRTVARRVAGAAGPDALTARLGGDEFLVIDVGDEAAGAALLVDVRDALSLPVRDGDGTGPTPHAALGLRHVRPGERRTVAEVLAEADRAMYADKRTRRRAGATA